MRFMLESDVDTLWHLVKELTTIDNGLRGRCIRILMNEQKHHMNTHSLARDEGRPFRSPEGDEVCNVLRLSDAADCRLCGELVKNKIDQHTSFT